MFSASPVLTLDRYRLFLPLPLTSVNSVPSALKSTLNSTAPLASAGHSPQATIPFRITSFAHPHHLTPIESHSCKKQGRGRYLAPPPNPFLFFPHRVNMQHAATPASPLFSCVYSTLPVTPGVGVLSSGGQGIFAMRIAGHGALTTCSLRASANSASLRYPFPHFSFQLSTVDCRLSNLLSSAFPLLTTNYSLLTVSPRTSTLPPPNYGIIPPHRGVSSSSLTTGRNPIRIWGGFSD